MTNRHILVIACIGLALIPLRDALGQTCTVTSPGISFGVYNPMAFSPINTSSTVTVICSSRINVAVAYEIQIGPGISGSYNRRSMSGLNYQIYSDAARSQVWGDGGGGTVSVADGYTFNSQIPVNRTYNIFAQLPARQSVAPGVYTDTVLLLIIY